MKILSLSMRLLTLWSWDKGEMNGLMSVAKERCLDGRLSSQLSPKGSKGSLKAKR